MTKEQADELNRVFKANLEGATAYRTPIIARERGILMAGPLIQPIIEGRKTQTRRETKYQNVRVEDVERHLGDNQWGPVPMLCASHGSTPKVIIGSATEQPADVLGSMTCPWGRPGDRLYVRETWCGPDDRGCYGYRAAGDRLYDELKWRPSIHMPRKAARILLEIQEVRVERLRGISPVDCMREGVVQCPIPADEHGPERVGYAFGRDDGASKLHVNPEQAFAELMDTLAPGTWQRNPWTWVISFRRI